MALLQSSCTMNAVEIKKQKNTPKVEENNRIQQVKTHDTTGREEEDDSAVKV